MGTAKILYGGGQRVAVNLCTHTHGKGVQASEGSVGSQRQAEEKAAKREDMYGADVWRSGQAVREKHTGGAGGQPIQPSCWSLERPSTLVERRAMCVMARIPARSVSALSGDARHALKFATRPRRPAAAGAIFYSLRSGALTPPRRARGLPR